MCKAALERLLESYREEAQLGRHGHCIFLTVNPGMFASPLWHRLMHSEEDAFPVLTDMRQAVADHGLPDASEVGERLVTAIRAAEHSGVITL